MGDPRGSQGKITGESRGSFCTRHQKSLQVEKYVTSLQSLTFRKATLGVCLFSIELAIAPYTYFSTCRLFLLAGSQKNHPVTSSCSLRFTLLVHQEYYSCASCFRRASVRSHCSGFQQSLHRSPARSDP